MYNFVFFVVFTLDVCCYYHSRCFYYVLLAAKRTKSPGTRDVAVGCCFVRKLPLGNISQSLPTLSRKSFRLLFGCCGTLSVSCTCTSNQRSYSPRTISKKQTAFRCATYGAGFVYKLPLLWLKLSTILIKFIEWCVAWLLRIKFLVKRRQWFLVKRPGLFER